MRSEVRRSVSEGIRGQLHQLPEMWPEPERAPAREWSESPEPEPERRRRGGEEETVSCSPHTPAWPAPAHTGDSVSIPAMIPLRELASVIIMSSESMKYPRGSLH